MPCMKRGVRKASEEGAGRTGPFAACLHIPTTR